MGFYTPKEFADAPVTGGRRKVVYENETLFLTIEFDPGYKARPHNHTWATLYYITGGEGRALVGDEWREVRAGTLVMIPPHTMHAIEATTLLSLTEVQCNCPQSFVDQALSGRGLVR